MYANNNNCTLIDITPTDWGAGIACVTRKIRSSDDLSKSQLISISLVSELIERRDDMTQKFASKQQINSLLYEICRS